MVYFKTGLNILMSTKGKIALCKTVPLNCENIIPLDVDIVTKFKFKSPTFYS